MPEHVSVTRSHHPSTHPHHTGPPLTARNTRTIRTRRRQATPTITRTQKARADKLRNHEYTPPNRAARGPECADAGHASAPDGDDDAPEGGAAGEY